jgi:hypothetical protein
MVGEFSWTTSFNIAANRNNIVDLVGQVIEGGDYNRAFDGSPIGVFFTVEFAGADPSNGDAIWYLNTADDAAVAAANPGTVFEHNGRFVSSDYSLAERKVVGDPNPDFIGGFNNTFSYKGFDLNVLFQFVTGNQIHNAGGLYMSASYDWFDNQTADQMNGWTPENTNTDIPEARFAWGNGTQDSDRWMEDGDFIRLKTVSLAYILPRSFLSRVGINSARIYFTGQNLITWTKYSGWDPEVNTDFLASNIGLGNDFYAAPQARTLMAGINLGF